ncbi:MAG: hypothetical protein [Arizlama microvirus]|nr:MAG: hypothetical protein [Arizlama microvirus]
MTKRQRPRDANAVASWLQLGAWDPFPIIRDRSSRTFGEDRRFFYPEPFQTSWRPATRFSDVRARLTVHPNTNKRSTARLDPFAGLSPVVSFHRPDSVRICVRRKQRREVLHAKRVAGRAGLARPRRSVYSSISCR